MNCGNCQDLMYEYLDGTLRPGQEKAIAAHLDTCPACRAAFDAEIAFAAKLNQDLTSATADLDVAPHTVFKVNAARATDRTARGSPWRFVMKPHMLLQGSLVVVIGAVVGGILLAMFMPVYKMTSSMSTGYSGESARKVALKSKRLSIELPRLYTINYGYVGPQDAQGGQPRYTEYFDDNWGGGTTNFFPSAFTTEDYSPIYENEFLEARNNPLSTFSIDVDAASYANVRRFINERQRPPKDAVRIEELVNYFEYDYPQPTNKHPFAIITEAAQCPWNKEHSLVMIGLQGRKLDLATAPPNNLVFLLDVSGSMDEPDKLPLLKSAFKLLARQLRPVDRVAIVVYASASGLVLDSTPGNYRDHILGAIDALQAGGCTAGGAGIQLAYKTAKEHFLTNGNNRVILATDGDFNVGVSSDAELVRMIEQKRDDGIYLSVLGLGTGNYKDNKMEQLADKGNGNFYYLDNLLEAKKVLVNQLGGTLVTIAKDVKLQIEFNPSTVKAYRLIGYENRMLKAEEFNDDKKDAGELGAGHSVTAFYEVVPAGSTQMFASVDTLKYQASTVTPSDELLTVKFRYKKPTETNSILQTQSLTERELEKKDESETFRFASAVAEFGLLLRDSQFKGKASFESALSRARGAKGVDNNGYRAEFIRMAEQAELLDAKSL